MNRKHIEKLKFLPVIALIFVSFLTAFAQTSEKEKTENRTEIIASGGSFTLEKTVTAGGGNDKQSAAISETGTTGQTIAGARSNGGSFALYSGFWTPDNLAPSAAGVTIGGRVLTASGEGIRNVRMTIVFPTGETRTTTSGSFGFYRFTDVPAGGFYVISAAAKKYTFAQPTQVRQINDDLADADFVANPE